MGVGRPSVRDSVSRTISELNEINDILSSDAEVTDQVRKEDVRKCVDFDTCRHRVDFDTGHSGYSAEDKNKEEKEAMSSWRDLQL